MDTMFMLLCDSEYAEIVEETDLRKSYKRLTRRSVSLAYFSIGIFLALVLIFDRH